MRYLIENLQSQNMHINVNEYSLKTDPIFKLAVSLKKEELLTTTKPFLLDYNEALIRSKSEVKIDLKDSNNASDKTDEYVIENSDSKPENLDSWFTKSFKPRKKAQGKRLQKTNSTASVTSSASNVSSLL